MLQLPYKTTAFLKRLGSGLQWRKAQKHIDYSINLFLSLATFEKCMRPHVHALRNKKSLLARKFDLFMWGAM